MSVLGRMPSAVAATNVRYEIDQKIGNKRRQAQEQQPVEALVRELVVDALTDPPEAAACGFPEEVAGGEEHDRRTERGSGYHQRGCDPAPKEETEREREHRPAGQAQ